MSKDNRRGVGAWKQAKGKPRDPYIAIMKAAKEGRGVRLSYDECWSMHLDDAIATAAMNGQRHINGQDKEKDEWS